jgi:hypothetical protein
MEEARHEARTQDGSLSGAGDRGGPGHACRLRKSARHALAVRYRVPPLPELEWVSKLGDDASGKVIPLAGTDVLRIVFDQAAAHSADGTRSTIVSQPGRPIGHRSMTDYAQAGDYEGVLTYGIGTTRAVLDSNPQTYVRAYEVEVVTAVGQHCYVVAIDINAVQHD